MLSATQHCTAKEYFDDNGEQIREYKEENYYAAMYSFKAQYLQKYVHLL
jgi:hypothetical protein